MESDNLPEFVYLHKKHKFRLKLGFYAAPSNPKIFSKAIKDELNKLKFTYCSDLNGLIMGFGKISSNELIPADIRHCISVAVYVDIYVFRPPVGSIIEDNDDRVGMAGYNWIIINGLPHSQLSNHSQSMVNQTSNNHVSCLVHNLFNVSIVRPENEPYDEWPGSKVKKDDKINVKVLSFDLTKKLPHITGDIINKENEKCYNPKDDSDNYSTKEFVNDFIKSVNNTEKEDSSSSSKLSINSSASSDEIDTLISHSKNLDYKANKTSSLLHTTINNNEHIKSPLSSSTPSSSSVHTIGSINLIRNKQVKQLHKHLNKISTGKQKLDTNEDNFSQSSNMHTNIKNNYNNNKRILPTTQVGFKNSDGANIINQQSNLHSDSGISDDELKQTIFSSRHSFSNTLKQSSKAEKNADEIVNSIIYSLSEENFKFENNISKNNSLVNPNTDHSSSEDDENTVYTQKNIYDNISSDEKNSVFTQHNLTNLINSNEDKHDNSRSTNKPIIEKSLRLSTKSIKKHSMEVKKRCKNQIENNISNQQLSIDLPPMISTLDSSSCNDDKELPIKNTGSVVSFNKNYTINNLSKSKIDDTKIQNTSSSDDEIYTKLKQNISKKESTKYVNEKTDDQTSDKINLFNFLSDTSVSSSNSMKSNTSKVNSINMLKNYNFSINTDMKLSLNNKSFKKEKKKKIPTFHHSLNSSNKNNESLPKLLNKKKNKNELIKQILEDSNSKNEIKCIPYKSNTTDRHKLLNQIDSNKVSSSNVLKLNKNTSNSLIESNAINVSSSCSEDDALIVNVNKKKEISPSKKNPLTKQKNKKQNLIKNVLNSLKHINKDEHSFISSNSYEDSKLCNMKELKTNKSKVKMKNKKNTLKNLKNPITEYNSSISTLNISEKDNLQPLKMSSFSDSSTDDEIEFLKKIIEKQNKKTNVPELTIKSSIPTKLNKQKKSKPIKNKLKSECSSMVTTHAVKKKKKPKDTKKLLLDSIITALEDSPNKSSQPNKKKKSNDQIIEAIVSKDNNSEINLTEVKKTKKKKKKHNEDFNDIKSKKQCNDLSVQCINQSELTKSRDKHIDIPKKKKIYMTEQNTADKSINKLVDKSMKIHKNIRSSQKKKIN